MKCLIMFISLFNIIHFGFFKNVTLDCWERNNLFINVDDLPLLLEQFTICFEKCQQSKNNECFTVASQLNSSIPVLRELYYNGQISFWLIHAYNDLYNKAVKLCSIHPEPIPNWLVIENTNNYSVLYDMKVMLTKDEKHICNELIIISKDLDCLGSVQLIPIPSFDVDVNPQHLILPYKNDFMIEINDTRENMVIYNIYFQSMKCTNIINKNAVTVQNILNKNFKHWIVNQVIPVANVEPGIVPSFGAVYRILNLAEEFEKNLDNKDICGKISKNKIIGYPNMTFGLMKSKVCDHNKVRIYEVLQKYNFVIILVIFFIVLVLSRVCYTKWIEIYGDKNIPMVESVLVGGIHKNTIKDKCTSKHESNRLLGKVIPNLKNSRTPIHRKTVSNESLVKVNNDVMSLNSVHLNTLSRSDFIVYTRGEKSIDTLNQKK